MSFARLVDGLQRRAVLLMPVVMLLGLGVRGDPRPGMREDEVECEEAKAHLLECCPTFSSNLACSYVDNGACEAPTYPDLASSVAVSEQSMSCAEIQKSDLCEHQYNHSQPDDGY